MYLKPWSLAVYKLIVGLSIYYAFSRLIEPVWGLDFGGVQPADVAKHVFPMSSSTCRGLRYKNKCYFFGLTREPFFRAREACNAIGHRLARIFSHDEANFLAKHLRKTGQQYFWIDASDEYREGVWTHEDGTPAFVDYWNILEPNGEYFENCGELIVAGREARLNDKICIEWRRYICERELDMACPRVGWRSKCYWFSMMPVNFYVAQEFCQTRGMRLARIRGTDEANFLAQAQPTYSWVDGGYGGGGSAYTFPGGTAANMGGMYGGYGYGGGGGMMMTQRCSELRKVGYDNGRIIGQDCYATRHFICERDPLPWDSVGSSMDDIAGVPGPGFVGPAGGPMMGGGYMG